MNEKDPKPDKISREMEDREVDPEQLFRHADEVEKIAKNDPMAALKRIASKFAK